VGRLTCNRAAVRLRGVAIAAAMLLLSCGHSADQTTIDPPLINASSVAISVSPANVALVAGKTQQFNATVTGSDNAGVVWSVDKTVAGNATIGTISSTGLYTAPPDAGNHSVSARAMADQTKTASAQVTIMVPAESVAEVVTERYDNRRTGLNSTETMLTPLNVNSSSFGKIASYRIDGFAFAQPLYIPNLDIPGHGTMDVVYVATEHDSVYAFDASGKVSGSLWQRSFIDPENGIRTVAQSEVGSTIYPEIGITSTPVIDPKSQLLYIEALTEENGTFIQRIHALDLTTGEERLGGPVVIGATMLGINFDAKLELQRASLLLQNGMLYVAFASHGDYGAYHGWVLAYDASTLKQTAAWMDTGGGKQGGIWMSGCGLSADDDGNVYLVSGNGTFDAASDGPDYGDSVVKLSPGLAVQDYFTPFNQTTLREDDLDLGSSGLMLIPNTTLATVAGKQGILYLLETTNLGKFHLGGDNQIVQSLPDSIGTGEEDRNFSTAAFFNDFIYYVGQNDTLKQFQLAGGKLNPTPVAISTHTFGAFGAQPAVSSNGNQDGILWVVEHVPNGANGVLHAYNASNVAIELYNSSQTGTRDSFGAATKFSVASVASGRVYVGGESQLAIFGLLH